MTELNWKISKAIEAKPAAYYDSPRMSPKRAWVFTYSKAIPVGINCHYTWDYYPQDWIGDEEASAFLLEMMPTVRLSRYNGKWVCEYNWLTLHTQSIHTDRKIAIAETALAYLLRAK